MMFSFSLFISRPPENIPSATAGILITPKIKRDSKTQQQYWVKLNVALKDKSGFEQRQTIWFNIVLKLGYHVSHLLIPRGEKKETSRLDQERVLHLIFSVASLILSYNINVKTWSFIYTSFALVTNIAFSFICSQSSQRRHLLWEDHMYVETFIFCYQLHYIFYVICKALLICTKLLPLQLWRLVGWIRTLAQFSFL